MQLVELWNSISMLEGSSASTEIKDFSCVECNLDRIVSIFARDELRTSALINSGKNVRSYE